VKHLRLAIPGKSAPTRAQLSHHDNCLQGAATPYYLLRELHSVTV
jgi:hypothetical protein